MNPRSLFRDSKYFKYYRILRVCLCKKPLLFLRVLRNYFKMWVLKKKILRKVEMGVTFDCQCSCAKCSSAFMRDPAREKLTLPEIRKTAKEILEMGALQINLTGGEPLLAPDLFEIIECFQPDKIVVTINTNGVLLTEGMIDRLESAGVDIIKISIDSPIEEEHDRSRGRQGCFRQAIRAFEYIKKKKGILAQISTVCISENLRSERIWDLVRMAEKYDALLGLTIPSASGKWVDNKDILVNESEAKVLEKIMENPHVVRDTEESYTKKRCPAGTEELYLTCYGDIIPCPLIQLSFGNVKEESVKDIWKRMMDFGPFKDKDYAGCFSGENMEFIEKYLKPLKDYTRLPLAIKEHPSEREERGSGRK